MRVELVLFVGVLLAGLAVLATGARRSLRVRNSLLLGTAATALAAAVLWDPPGFTGVGIPGIPRTV